MPVRDVHAVHGGADPLPSGDEHSAELQCGALGGEHGVRFTDGALHRRRMRGVHHRGELPCIDERVLAGGVHEWRVRLYREGAGDHVLGRDVQRCGTVQCVHAEHVRLQRQPGADLRQQWTVRGAHDVQRAHALLRRCDDDVRAMQLCGSLRRADQPVPAGDVLWGELRRVGPGRRYCVLGGERFGDLLGRQLRGVHERGNPLQAGRHDDPAAMCQRPVGGPGGMRL